MTMSPGDPGPTDPPRDRLSRPTRAAGSPRTSTARGSCTATGRTSVAPPARSRATSRRRPEPAGHPAAGPSRRRPTNSRRRSRRSGPGGGVGRAGAPPRHDPRRGRRRRTRRRRWPGAVPAPRSWSPASGTCSAPTTASVRGRPAAGRRAVAGRRPGDRLRHPRPAPGLRPARPLGGAGAGRRAARPRRRRRRRRDRRRAR